MPRKLLLNHGSGCDFFGSYTNHKYTKDCFPSLRRIFSFSAVLCVFVLSKK
jgi:hypothetical protein